MQANDIENQLNRLQDQTNEQLLNIIGAYGLSQEPQTLTEQLAINGILNIDQLQEAGRRFLESMKPVLIEGLCGPKGILHHVETPSTTDIVNAIIVTLGLSQLGIVPTAILAIAVIIGRAGLRVFCEGIMEI